jgi:hypothetical protein
MAYFGISKEFTDRYGSLGATVLVKGICRQLLGRDPEAAGLNSSSCPQPAWFEGIALKYGVSRKRIIAEGSRAGGQG